MMRADLIEEAMAGLESLMDHRRRLLKPPHRGVSLPQLYILTVLQTRGALTMSELANMVGVSAPSASALIDRLEAHGFVSRERDEVDRRVVHVHLTPQGDALVEEVMGVRREYTQRLLDAMSDAELDSVVHALHAVHRVLDEAEGDSNHCAALQEDRDEDTALSE